MKKILLSFSLLLFVLLANAQFNEINKSGKLEWVKQIGGLGNEEGKSITFDQQGNVYSTGYHATVVDMDPGESVFNLKHTGRYISKLDASGNFVWAKNIGGFRQCGITVDGSGNIYSAGYFNIQEGLNDFDPDTAKTFYLRESGIVDIFISKLDGNGNFLWAKSIGGKEDDRGTSVSLDASGNVYVTGHFSGTVDFDPDTLSSYYLTSEGPQDIFILKLSASGNFVWARKMGGDLGGEGVSIVLDKSGNIYTSGWFLGKTDFDPDLSKTFYLSTINPTMRNVFISKLNTEGNFVWAKSFKGNGASYSASLAVDLLDNVYISGSFLDKVDFDPDSSSAFELKSSGFYDIFISKLNSLGNLIWAKSFGDISDDESKSIALDNAANVYISGGFRGTVDFDGGKGTYKLVSAGYDDMFILKLDGDGNFVWVKKMGGTYPEDDLSIAVDSKDNVYASGHFYDKIDFEGFGERISLSSKGQSDIVICKLSQDACSNMALIIDSLRNSSCIDTTAYTSALALNGHPPYNYLWNTVPPVKKPTISFATNGIYSLILTDANACTRMTSVIINGYQGEGLDLNANLTSGRYIPGEQSQVWIDGLNKKCNPVNGNLSFVLSKNVNYNSASPSPDHISGDTLIWNFKNLSSDSKPLKPIINVTTKTNVKITDSACFDIAISPLKGDKDPSNNKKRYCFPIRVSYDPNIKSVYPPGACEQGYVLKNKPLTYTVQFQNTGTAEAINIYILDTLDTHLDIKSFRLVGYSHKAPIVELLPGRALEFRFENINLPDSFSDEKGSHGYVVFEIMPDSAVVNGTLVNGKAGIYFDYNEPVFTNTVKNTLTNSIPLCNVGIRQPKILKPVHIYPNPNTGNFMIEIENPGRDVSIEVFDMMGKLIKTVETIPNQAIYSVDLNSVNGIYYVKVKNGGIVYNQKVVLGN